MAIFRLAVPRFVVAGLLILLASFHTAVPVVIFSRNKNGSPSRVTRPVYWTSSSGCSLSTGKWIPDDSPYSYTSDCPVIGEEYNCLKFGRQDTDYLRYRWKPDNCDLPSFDAKSVLEYAKNKTVMFVGDSLGRDQWNSLVCMLLAGFPGAQIHWEDSDLARFTFLVKIPKRITEFGSQLHCHFFKKFNAKFYFHKARYLVDVDEINGRRILKLDDISGNSNIWRGADVLVFNTGHWWSHQKSNEEWIAMENGGESYSDMDRSSALKIALTTWSSWIDGNTDQQQIFFSSVSPKHFECYGKTEPLKVTQIPEDCFQQMKIVMDVIGKMEKPPVLIDVTTMSSARIDAHPSIYSSILTPNQRSHPDQYADCSHWCLPGLPDSWNQLFAAALLHQK